MEKQDYTWAVIAAMLAAQQLNRQKNQSGAVEWHIPRPSAYLGTFQGTPPAPANDIQATSLFKFLLLLYLIHAKNCANLPITTPFLCKTRAQNFPPQIPRKPPPHKPFHPHTP